jgi:hypothetical protein
MGWDCCDRVSARLISTVGLSRGWSCRAIGKLPGPLPPKGEASVYRRLSRSVRAAAVAPPETCEMTAEPCLGGRFRQLFEEGKWTPDATGYGLSRSPTVELSSLDA